MTGLAARLAAACMEPLRQSLWRSGRVLVLVLVALAFLTVALAFATAAVSFWLTALYDPTTAAWILAAVFSLMGALALALAVRQRSSGRRPRAFGVDTDGLGISAHDPSVKTSGIMLTGDLTSLVAGIVSGNRLKPFELVSLAVLTGFLVGRRNGRN
jgi:hypothetical protein